MLRKSFIRPVLFIGTAIFLLFSTSLYSQTSKISYRLSAGYAHASLDEFWESYTFEDWRERNNNFKNNYFTPQAGLNLKYDLNQKFSLLFGAEITKISTALRSVGNDGPPDRFGISRNNFYFIPFNAGFEYSLGSNPVKINPFFGFGLSYTLSRLSFIFTNNYSDRCDVSNFRKSAYGMYVTLGFKRKLTDKLGLLFMGKYRNSDSIFGIWNNNDIILNLSGFNLGMAVEWSQ